MPTFLAREAGKDWNKPYVVHSRHDGKWYAVSKLVKDKRKLKYGGEYKAFDTETEANEYVTSLTTQVENESFKRRQNRSR